jgi:hypothetical protein
MGGKTIENWMTEYDTACRNEESNEAATVELAGRDLYIHLFIEFDYSDYEIGYFCRLVEI